MAQLTFCGAAQTVTGSKHFLTVPSGTVLVDCGLYQGVKSLRERNWEALPFSADRIDAVVITHAHVDHIGFLPRLVRGGYRGPIFATPPTCDLMKIMLPDSARLQEEEAKFANRKGFSKHAPALPLYTEEDAVETLALVRSAPFEEPFEVMKELSIRFLQSGHILGSALVEGVINEATGKTTVLFSGDLGRAGTPMLEDPEIVSRADYLVLESTYGDRLHAVENRREALRQAIRKALGRGGALVIPAFAVERTQEILYILHLLRDAKDIPNVPIYIDSPMAVEVTKLFIKYQNTFDEDAMRIIRSGDDVLDVENLRFCSSVEESKAVNAMKGPMIVISASGMATGGRILHHLKHRLPDSRNTVLLVGYQAVSTRGRLLQEGAKSVRIHGEDVPVRAEIQSIDGFSSHADYREILSWLGHFEAPPKSVFLVHGETPAQEALKTRIIEKFGWNVEVPSYLTHAALQ